MSLVYFETEITETGSTSFGGGGWSALAGIGSTLFTPLNDPINLDVTGTDADMAESAVWQFVSNSSSFLRGASGTPTGPGMTTQPQRIGWHVDTTLRKLWNNNISTSGPYFGSSSGSGSPSPATGNRGFDLSSGGTNPITGDMYVVGGVGWNSGKPLASLTLFGGTDIIGTPEAGYNAIDATIAFNPSDSAPDIAFTNDNKTITVINTLSGSNQPTRFVRSNFAIDYVPPVPEPFVITRSTVFSPGPIVALEADLFDGNEIQTLYVSNRGQISGTDKFTTKEFEPWLKTPFLLGPSISAENYGQSVRGSSSSNNITFSLTDDFDTQIGYDWIGRDFRIFTGVRNRELTEVYAGVFANIGHDTFIVSVQATDKSFVLNVPLISSIYDNTFPASIQGKARPKLFGQGKMLEPNLIDANAQVYEISFDESLDVQLDEILEVSVGGVIWQESDGDTPVQGQWAGDLVLGRFTLGSETRGGEVRCRARAVGWETLTTGKFMQQIAEAHGAEFDEDSLTQFETNAPYLIGFYAKDPLNCLDVLDAAATSVGGYWTFGPLGTLIAGVLDTPSTTATFEISADQLSTMSLTLDNLLSPAWRIRIQYDKNWQVGSQFFDAVSADDKQTMQAAGTIAAPFEDQTIKSNYIMALDAPLIDSFVLEEADALEIRDRLVRAWSVQRGLYTLNVWLDEAPDLYETMEVDYKMVSGNFRIHSSLRAFGGGPCQLKLWG